MLVQASPGTKNPILLRLQLWIRLQVSGPRIGPSIRASSCPKICGAATGSEVVDGAECGGRTEATASKAVADIYYSKNVCSTRDAMGVGSCCFYLTRWILARITETAKSFTLTATILQWTLGLLSVIEF